MAVVRHFGGDAAWHPPLLVKRNSRSVAGVLRTCRPRQVIGRHAPITHGEVPKSKADSMEAAAVTTELSVRW